MEPKKNRHTGWIVLALLILVIAGSVIGVYRYLTGEMERDSFVPAEELSTVDTGNIVRETMPETTEIGLLDEEGNATSLELPEEALLKADVNADSVVDIRDANLIYGWVNQGGAKG